MHLISALSVLANALSKGNSCCGNPDKRAIHRTVENIGWRDYHGEAEVASPVATLESTRQLGHLGLPRVARSHLFLLGDVEKMQL